MYDIYLQEIKDILHILHDRDDNRLISALERGHRAIEGFCGEFPMTNVRGRTLVYDWVRFSFHGQSEYFYDSFKPELNMFGFELYNPESDGEVNG